jgi:spore maturation protein CgeB
MKKKKIKLLYLGQVYDYGDPRRGKSFPEVNMKPELFAHPRLDVTQFDHVELHRVLGKQEMNRRLLETVKKGSFDALFCVMRVNELDFETLIKIRDEYDTVTIAWGCDDHWRFDSYTRFYAPCFNWWVTTAKSALPKFEAIGYKNVIKSQWACSPTTYYPLPLPKDKDVTFVGQPHSNRPQIIQYLLSLGIKIEVYGYGWYPPDPLRTRISHEQMIEIFSRSKINLNLSNSSTMRGQQIKGRNFEVPCCKGFLLTDPAEDLESYFEPDKEIVIFNSIPEMVEKIRYYLKHEDEREKIAEAGYKRVMEEHTWRHRFDEIFKKVGLF